MLEDTGVSAGNDDLPRPPSGRSSSRPAGPPIVTPPVFSDTGATEAPARRTRAAATRRTRKTAVDGDQDAPKSTESKPTTRARRSTAKSSATDAAGDTGAESTPKRHTAKRSAAADATAAQPDAAPASRTRRGSRRAKTAEPTTGDQPKLPKELATAPAPREIEAGSANAEIGAALAATKRTTRTTRRRKVDPEAAARLVGDEVTVDEHGEASADAVLAQLTEAISDGAPAPSRRSRRRSAASSEPEDEATPDTADAESDSDSGEDAPHHRRRRRGGRRRRRGDGDETVEAEEHSDEDPEEGTSHRRRRRRRRRGEDLGGADDDPHDVVVRVREPRSHGADEVSGIEGSTRVEAKRQRRKDSRSAGRRAPILTEAEFLARREAVDRRMVIRQGDGFSQLAVLEDDVLVEHYVDRASATSLIGNIYLGKVQNVLPGMEAAFVDIGRGRNAVLYAGEVDWAAYGEFGESHKIEDVLAPGKTVLVQVSKDPIGAKGARLTNHVALAGRYVVYSPNGQLSGISRKLPDTERVRLKKVLSDVVDEAASVIVRTAAEGASQDELVRDIERLKAQWEVILRKVDQGSAPALLYAEPDLTLRIVRDLFTEDFSQLVIAGNGGPADAYDSVEGYVGHVAPHLADRLVRWDSADGDPFAKYRVDEQIAKALERKVYLPSGGTLIIDRTEAMTVIDVNTGKFTGSGGNLEETVTRNNLEAAEEIVRQLRLRDIGGIIVVDFIDMVLPSNRELLLRRLVECLGRDRTRHQVSEVTSLGLVQLTRKRIGTGLAEAFTETCDHCGGRGVILHDVPVASQAPADGGERKKKAKKTAKSAKSDKKK